ncbi:MAG: hypothetical protein NTZ95_06515 [Candidatus Omnitrophica bacterium]|nr:hypothetical protein [Candidatus Omnitrophota bacterium]
MKRNIMTRGACHLLAAVASIAVCYALAYADSDPISPELRNAERSIEQLTEIFSRTENVIELKRIETSQRGQHLAAAIVALLHEYEESIARALARAEYTANRGGNIYGIFNTMQEFGRRSVDALARIIVNTRRGMQPNSAIQHAIDATNNFM